ncbi:MAG: hypothetical protein RR272_02115 [Synergistaceae bacterium]
MDLERYSVISEKNPREIVLLRGHGCRWKKCSFCDYHLDFSLDQSQNDILNSEVLNSVTGIYKKLEVINSGSFSDLSNCCVEKIINLCHSKNIDTLHTEFHWIERDKIPLYRELLAKKNISLKVKSGVETFDYDLRENYLHKGINEKNHDIIASFFNEACFLFGIEKQTFESMTYDINEGLRLFERICINIMSPNSTKIKPHKEVIEIFLHDIYPHIKDNKRIDILLNNCDFGIGNKGEN